VGAVAVASTAGARPRPSAPPNGGAGSSNVRAGLTKVSVAKVGKRFGTERALAGVTLELTAGSMCALLGHNGAGKTTLLGILSTLVRPTDGKVRYLRGDVEVPQADDLRREIGLLAHASLCYGELTATENLELVAGLYELDGGAPAITAVLDQVGLAKAARDRPARVYSRGMLQRLALARALLTNPSLLLLDEPFTGLDRGGAITLGEQLGALKTRGTIVVVVTHDLEAIADRTDHVAVLRRGQLVHEQRADSYGYAELKDIYHRHAD
jgi:heme exporter protein A